MTDQPAYDFHTIRNYLLDAGYPIDGDAMLAVDAAEDAMAALKKAEAVAWRIRIGSSDTWGYCGSETDADFYGKASGLTYIKEPLYAHAPAVAVESLDSSIIKEAGDVLEAVGASGVALPENWRWPLADELHGIAAIMTAAPVDSLGRGARKARTLIDHFIHNEGGIDLLHEAHDILTAEPVASVPDGDARRLLWVSHAWGGQRPDYAMHVLQRGGDGDLSDIRTFIDQSMPTNQEGAAP